MATNLAKFCCTSSSKIFIRCMYTIDFFLFWLILLPLSPQIRSFQRNLSYIICILECLGLIFMVADETWLIRDHKNWISYTICCHLEISQMIWIHSKRFLCVPIYHDPCFCVSERDIQLFNWTWSNLKLPISFKWHVVMVWWCYCCTRLLIEIFSKC